MYGTYYVTRKEKAMGKLNTKPFDVVLTEDGLIQFLFENGGFIVLDEEASMDFMSLAFDQALPK